jgi:excinuclease ABC subunit A
VRVHNLKNLDVEIPRNSLVAVTGVSGAGKSSLVIDTICAEGQRRYLESLDPYSRQFVGKMSNPDVDFAVGIPPTISPKKVARSHQWRSTVGTATEIYNYLRLLFAKIGVVHCYQCGREMQSASAEQIAEELEEEHGHNLVFITFGVNGSPSGKLMDRLVRDGYTRAIVGNSVQRIDDLRGGRGRKRAEVHVVVDRVTPGRCGRKRLVDSLENAYREGSGALRVHVAETAVLRYSARSDCAYCGTEPVSLSPALFSFNSPAGTCPQCRGSGMVAEVDLQAVIPDGTRSIQDGAIASWEHPQHRWALNELRIIAHKYGLSLRVPFKQLSRKHRKLVLEGETYFPGVYRFFEMLEQKRHKPGVAEFLEMYRKNVECPACAGNRLNPQAVNVHVNGFNIAQLCRAPLSGLKKRLAGLKLDHRQRKIAGGAIEQIVRRVDCLTGMGLGYLTLDRDFASLSEGEARRVNLAGFLAADLSGSLYVLDEPTVGLHPCDRERLFTALEALKERGNTVIVIEHDRRILERTDQVIELGPGAGRAGGEIVFQGTYGQMLSSDSSLTGKHLSGRSKMPPHERRQATGYLKIIGAHKHNLRDINLKIPLGVLVCVTGVSGSGKSVLLRDVLYAGLAGENGMLPPERKGYVALEGAEQVRRVIFADHSSAGNSPRSVPLSYIGLYARVRALFAGVRVARVRGYRGNHFSFNAKAGRCPNCKGLGYIDVAMNLVPNVRAKCSACEGRRFKDEILQVRFRGKNIADVLDMTAEEAVEFFRDVPEIREGLGALDEVGLVYLQLGQPLASLSRGEAQLLRLASCVSRSAGGDTLFLFDEPTAGLHFEDVRKLSECFGKLIERGNSVIVAEHNMELVRYADYVVDLGPGAGRSGGRVVARGTPQHIARCKSSKTGKVLEACSKGAGRRAGPGVRAVART